MCHNKYMHKRGKLPKRIIALIVCGCIIFSIGVIALGFYIHFLCAHSLKCIPPKAERVDISAVLDKEVLSQEDYSLLYSQTGLTKVGIDRAREKGDAGKRRILAIQDDVYKQYGIIHDTIAPYACQDDIDGDVTNIYLEKGDIIVTSSTHIAGFRIGHSGLVTDVSSNGISASILQASVIGETSDFGSFADFSSRINFIILRPKPELISKGDVENICTFAKENLTGLTYFPAAGVLSAKENYSLTQCSHLIWSAYNHFGFDLDSNGGMVVTPKNLSHSAYLEPVQVFGFDYDKLWE